MRFGEKIYSGLCGVVQTDRHGYAKYTIYTGTGAAQGTKEAQGQSKQQNSVDRRAVDGHPAVVAVWPGVRRPEFEEREADAASEAPS